LPASNVVPLAAPPVRRTPQQEATDMRAYENLGDWLLGVRAERVTKRHDRRVRAAAPSTGANEGSGADGGYAVPPELADQIISAVSAISIVGRCKQLPARTNAPVIPLDHEAPWLASNCFWDQEMVAMDQSKPVFAQASFRLNKVTCLIPISSETLEDTNLFDGWARNAIPKKIAAKLTRAIVRGTGAGQLAGILGHPSTIAVTRGMSQ
jgi:HK97 family phage major capsid protein